MMSIRVLLLSMSLAVLLSVLSSCQTINGWFASEPEPWENRRISEMLPPSLEFEDLPVQMTVKKYRAAITYASGVPKIRMIRVYDKVLLAAITTGIPEYRLFQVDAKGPFGVLGLRSGDILFGAHGFVILSPERFLLYPEALLVDKKSSLLYRRKGKLFKAQIELTS